ncbi:DUF3592 domain-containing protein [bacterium]|nr:DUF3592 domain-containing protein [bacterium]
MSAPQSTKQLSRGGKYIGFTFFFLFFGAFAAVGITAFQHFFFEIVQGFDAQAWEATPATIQSVELKEQRRHRDNGGTSITYSVKAKYQYEYNGDSYIANRVYAFPGSDSSRDYHQSIHNQLQSHKNSGEPYTCYVNPDNPSEAVLIRDIRYGTIAAGILIPLIFAAIGLFFLYRIIKYMIVGSPQEKLQKEYPNQPWMWNPNWREGRIKHSYKAKTLFMAGGGVLFSLAALPAMPQVMSEIQQGEYIAWLVFLFPLAGLALLGMAVKNFLQWRKFGESVLELTTVPGMIGGHLSGVVMIPKKLHPRDGFHLTLTSYEKIRRNRGRNNSGKSHTQITPLWQRDRTISRDMMEDKPDTTAIPVYFEIPDHVEESTVTSGHRSVSWRLKIDAEVEGMDYSTQFEVPVFKTESPIVRNEKIEAAVQEMGGVAADSTAEPVSAEEFHDPHITVQPLTAGGVRIDVPPGRYRSYITVIGIMFIAFTAMAYFTFKEGIWLFAAAGVFFDIILVLIGLGLLFTEKSVEVRSRGIFYRGNLLGWKTEWMVSLEEIEELVPVKTASTQSGNQSTVYYGIDAKLQDGSKKRMALGVDDYDKTKQLIAIIMENLVK